MSAEAAAEAFAQQLRSWRDRALAAHPGDRQMRQTFMDGIALVLMEDVLTRTGAGGDASEIWDQAGMRAYRALVDPPQNETAPPPEDGSGAAGGDSIRQRRSRPVVRRKVRRDQ